MPIIQVIPSNGKRNIAAFSTSLKVFFYLIKSIHEPIVYLAVVKSNDESFEFPLRFLYITLSVIIKNAQFI